MFCINSHPTKERGNLLGREGPKRSSRQHLRLVLPPSVTTHLLFQGGGSTKNGRDSNGQRRGVKVYGGQPVKAGGIIVRQVGSTVSLLATLLHQACLLDLGPSAECCLCSSTPVTT